MIHRKLLSLGLLAVFAVGCVAAAEEKVLYEKNSAFNSIVVTEDETGLRTLMFEKNGIRQSVVKVGDPDRIELEYARVMPVGFAVVEEPRRVLIIGLGGGTIPNFLHKHFPKTHIDVVDIDPDVVDVAKKFFGFREDDLLHVYAKDGRKFIEECRTPYDLIMLDAYGTENIPYALATREFLQAVRRALSPKGAVVGNVFARRVNRLYDSMVRTYQDSFEELYVLDVQHAENNIFLAVPRAEPLDRDGLARRAKQLSKENGLPIDLGELVAYGFRQPKEKPERGRVLLDRDKDRQDD